MSEVEQFSPYKRRRYSRSEQAEARMKFRRKYGCCSCLNEWDFDSCMEMGVCRYEPKPGPAYLRTKDRQPCARSSRQGAWRNGRANPPKQIRFGWQKKI